MQKEYFIIDFDSAFIQLEGLDELPKIALKKDPDASRITSKIENITKLGMEGKISFEKSLEQRIALFKIKKTDIDELVEFLQKKITPSIERNKDFFKQKKDQIFLVSGGFRDWMLPIATDFGLDESHILGNEFIYDKFENVVGYDKSDLLSQKNGKTRKIQELGLEGEIFVIGDGLTDYEIKKQGKATQFMAFTENIGRAEAVKNADHILSNFDEFLDLQNLGKKLSYPKNKIKVLLLENIDKHAIKIFEKEGYAVESLDEALKEEELISKLKGVSILGIRSKTKITEKVVQNCPKLMSIGAFCVGINQLDIKACSKAGISVFNALHSNTRSVAELAIGELIMLFRRTFVKSTEMHNKIWNKSTKGSFEVRGKKLGIIGYGNIGSQVSVLAESLGMQVLFYDIVDKLSLGNARKYVELKELLKEVDAVTLHIDGRKANLNFFGEEEFQAMKNGALFLNLSRGFVVDALALQKNLQSGKLAGAAIDVFPEEPEKNTSNFETGFSKLENVILTPHIAGSTKEAQKDIADVVSNKIIQFVNTGNTLSSVSLPEIQLPKQYKCHRFIHIHHNVPGILAKINQVFAENKINIEGQYLKTNEEIGYVITDVNKDYSPSVIEKLKTISATIKFKVLY